MSSNKVPKTIFFSVSAPTIIRNFLILPESVLSYLTNAHVHVVLLVPRQSYEKVKNDFAGPYVSVEPLHIDWRKQTLLQKVYIFIAHYMIFTESAKLLALYGVRIDKRVAGGKQYLYFLKVLIAKTLGKSKFIKVTLLPWIDTLVYRDRPHKALFDTHKPRLVFLPDVLNTQDIALLREAKRQGIKTIGMPASWDHFPKRFEPLHTDILLVWSDIFKQEAIELHNYNEKDVFVVGIPQYDIFASGQFLETREDFLSRCRLDRNKKLISFFSSSIYAPDDGDIVDMLLRCMKEGKFIKPVQFLIRPYPGVQKEHKKFDVFSGEKDVYIDWIEPRKIFPHAGSRWYPSLNAIVHLKNIMYHSDIIINTYSSVGVEASMFTKPIININFDGYKRRPFSQSVKRFKHLSHYMHIKKGKGVKFVNNEDECLQAINEFLENPEANKVYVENTQKMMCSQLDGHASARIMKHILANIS